MKEHFIPRFYLKRWCSKSEHIYCFSYKNKRIINEIKSISRTGYGHNIYSRIENGQQVNSTEKLHYSNIDNSASIALDNILSRPTNENVVLIWKELIPFFISLLFRHPLTIEKSMHTGKPLFEDITKNIPLEDRRKYFSEIQDITYNFQVDLISAFTGYKDIFGLDIFKKYASVLKELNCLIIDFSKQKFSLLTSDFPVAAHVTEQKTNNNLIDDLRKGTIILSVPLSPFHVLYIGNDLSAINSTSKHSLIRERNLLSVNNAKFFIYASDLIQKEFIVNNFNSSLDICAYPFMNESDFSWQG